MKSIQSNQSTVFKIVLGHLVNNYSQIALENYMNRDMALKFNIPVTCLGTHNTRENYLELMSITFSCGKKCYAKLFASLSPKNDAITFELTRSGLKKVYEEYQSILINLNLKK